MPTKNAPKRKRRVYRKKKRSGYRKKTVKGSYVGRGDVIHPTVGSPLPQTYKTTLRYTENAKLQASGISTDRYILYANNCYDPDYTYGGHQPRGFDQMMALYSKYQVIGSKIVVQFQNATAYPGIVGICETKETIAQPYTNYIEGVGRVQYQMLGPLTGENNYVTMTERHSPKKFWSKSKIMDVEQLKGTASGNVTLPAYWHIFYYDIANNINNTAVYITYQIEYIVVFSEPIVVPAS